MRIDNVQVYGFWESLVASGLPMFEQYSVDQFTDSFMMQSDLALERAKVLASTPVGSGHGNFLTGIVVQMNITATVKWWEQWQRYHFQQIVSSMSTMHRLRKMMRHNTIRFNENTSKSVIEAFMRMLTDPEVTDEQLAYSCPMGIELTARVSTNYMQLKTMYNQRKAHKLTDWLIFCELIKSLPYAKELITGE